MLSKGSLEMIAWCKAGCPLPGDAPKQPERDDKPPKIDGERDAANDPEVIPADCVGSPIDPETGAMFWPWSPHMTEADVLRMRADLIGMIETLADMEEWPEEHRDDVLTRAIRGPLADMMPNTAYFRDRLSKARADAEARAALDRRTWRFDR